VLLLASCDHVAEPLSGNVGFVVDGRQILVEPELWRSFFPGSTPPDGDPLALFVHLRAPDSLALPSGLVATRAWVFDESGFWETELVREQTWCPPNLARYHAYDGPKWGPGIRVDVTVQVVQAGGGTWNVFIPGCVIEMCQ
jgi:hypothetical protein